jgi:hypothetical protein
MCVFFGSRSHAGGAITLPRFAFSTVGIETSMNPSTLDMGGDDSDIGLACGVGVVVATFTRVRFARPGPGFGDAADAAARTTTRGRRGRRTRCWISFLFFAMMRVDADAGADRDGDDAPRRGVGVVAAPARIASMVRVRGACDATARELCPGRGGRRGGMATNALGGARTRASAG